MSQESLHAYITQDEHTDFLVLTHVVPESKNSLTLLFIVGHFFEDIKNNSASKLSCLIFQGIDNKIGWGSFEIRISI